jgi:hypothetical protein
LKADTRGRIRFTKYGFRFEITETDPTTITVYDRVYGETKIGTINLTSAAFRLLNGTTGDETVKPARLEPVGVGGYY